MYINIILITQVIKVSFVRIGRLAPINRRETERDIFFRENLCRTLIYARRIHVQVARKFDFDFIRIRFANRFWERTDCILVY